MLLEILLFNQKNKRVNQEKLSEALGVEMEGAAFAQVARHFKTPLVAMRAISDNGDANADNDFDKFVKEVGAKAAKLISDYVEKMN